MRNKTNKYSRFDIKRATIVFAVGTAIALIVISISVIVSLNSSRIGEGDLKVAIPNGYTLNESIDLMSSHSVLRPAILYKALANFLGSQYSKTIKAGTHKFPDDLSNIEILKALFTGEYLYNKRITFPEGITLKRFASIAARQLKIDSSEFMRLAYSDSLVNSLGLTTPSVEGYLHPATYNFDLDVSPAKFLSTLIERQNELWKEKFEIEARRANLTRHQVLTLASIVEAETPIASERARVAGVYWNRISRGMLLQADPTVQFVVGHKKRLLYSDLKVVHPYNTYMYPGLPPGPINSPSLSSIDATINFERHNYLYFVAVGDGSNRHNFSRNFEEHKKYIRVFRNNIKKGK